MTAKLRPHELRAEVIDLQAPADITGGKRPDLSQIPLVGRTEHIGTILGALTGAGGGAFVIGGAPGVGKSRLAREVAKRLADGGHPTANVLATKSAASIPFGAFAPSIGRGLSASDGMLSYLQNAADAMLADHGDGPPLIMVVDDVQWLDDGSATLVHQLAGDDRCRLLLTQRSGVVAPDAVTALWKEDMATRLDLGPMTHAETDEFARTVLGGDVEGRLLQWLWEESAGNPMFGRELVIGALDAGDLLCKNDLWVRRRAGALASGPPPRLSELIGARLSGLPASCAEVVDLLAVGDSLALNLLEQLTSHQAIEEVEGLGLIVLTEQGRRTEVTLLHPLYAEVRRQEMPRAQVRRLSGSLAAAIRATGTLRQDDILRVASWSLDAGNRSDAELFAQAASVARERFDRELAAAFARVALDAGGGVEAALALGEAEFFAGNHEAAEKILSEAAKHCRTDEETMMIANARGYNLAHNMNDIERGMSVITEALLEIADPSCRLRLDIRRGTILVYSGQFDSAMETLAGALASDEPSVFHRGAMMAALVKALTGRAAEALELVDQGQSAMGQSTDATMLPQSMLVGSIFARIWRGELLAAEVEFRTGYRAVLEAKDNEAVATFRFLGGLILIEQGRLTEAAALLREAQAVNEEIDDLAALRMCVGALAVAEGMAGRAREASEALALLDELPQHWMNAFDGFLLERGRGWEMAARGELSAARAWLSATAQRCQAAGSQYAEVLLLHDVARLGDAAGVLARLDEIGRTTPGELVSLFANHARAAAASTMDDFEAVATGFEAVGAQLLAAEAATELGARCRLSGEPRRAARWERLAEGFRETYPGIRTPALVGTSGTTGRLTRRETEIARMAAEGLTSKEIADKLVLSVRTVDSHLQHIYVKLGVSRREEVAGALGLAD